MKLRLGAFLFVSLVLAGVVWYGFQNKARDQGRNLVLITLDTLRADHLGFYGYPKPTSPVLDRLAASSIVFDQAISQSAVTPVAHGALFTGLNPYRNGLRSLHGGEGHSLPATQTTLAEVMKENGYATAGFVSAFPATRYYGLEQGFEHWDEDFQGHDGVGHISPTGIVFTGKAQRRGDETLKRAKQWLRDRDESPWFLWLHLFDVHDAEILPPVEVLGQFPPAKRESPDILRAIYDAEIRFIDTQIGSLLKMLETSKSLKNTVVVVVGDHGEGLGDHDWWGHSILYQEQLRVPFLIHSPSFSEGRRVSEMVRAVDLLPTMVDLLGVEPPFELEALDGQSLVPLIEGEDTSLPVAYSESLNDLFGYQETPFGQDSLYSLNDGRWKLILRRRGAQEISTHLFDLARDPKELTDLSQQEPREAQRLTRLLDGLGAMADGAVPPSMDPEALERLRSLGYVN
ncbi:MAG: sulfatase [Deltaproteobacteria bacterium]|nr:sulfatase [Deltaproteobacteria bacterium]